MKLTKRQQDAYNTFVNKDYVFIHSSRRTGKTAFLKYIIEQNPDKQIGILCPNYAHYRVNFAQYKNCSYLNLKAPIILGDECVISKIADKKIACAITIMPKITKWLISSFGSLYIRAKKLMPANAFKMEFGNFVSKSTKCSGRNNAS